MLQLRILFCLLAVIFSMFARAESGKYCKETDANGNIVIKPCVYSSKDKPEDTEVITPDTPSSKTNKVDVYYASWDPQSNKVLAFFRENHIVVNAFDIELDTEAYARKKTLDPGFIYGIPLVVVNDGTPIRGVDEAKYREVLRIPTR